MENDAPRPTKLVLINRRVSSVSIHAFIIQCKLPKHLDVPGVKIRQEKSCLDRFRAVSLCYSIWIWVAFGLRAPSFLAMLIINSPSAHFA